MSDRDFSVSIHLDEPAQTLCSPIGNTAEPPIIPPSIGLSGLVVFTGEMRAQVPTGLAPFLRASLENATSLGEGSGRVRRCLAPIFCPKRALRLINIPPR